MIIEMIPVFVGGLLAILGGAFQTYLSASRSAKHVRNEKREDAYLGYINALLKIGVDDQWGYVKTKDFWDSFRDIQAKLRLYGSDNIIKKEQDFECHLFECLDCGSLDAGNTKEKKQELINAIRKEINIK